MAFFAKKSNNHGTIAIVFLLFLGWFYFFHYLCTYIVKPNDYRHATYLLSQDDLFAGSISDHAVCAYGLLPDTSRETLCRGTAAGRIQPVAVGHKGERILLGIAEGRTHR